MASPFIKDINSPTGLTKVIPSYLYQEYSDDNDLQAFVEVQNAQQQKYIDGFNNINLPIYTQDQISGYLLDWVATGLYGYFRPWLSDDKYYILGPFNTPRFNQIYPNEIKRLFTGTVTIANDDIYKRCLTWHFYKGDGKYFSIRWLKRRVARFIYGTNGIDPSDQTVNTYQISVTFGPDREITIRFVLYVRKIISGSICNFKGSRFNQTGFNHLETNLTVLPNLPMMETFKEAVNSGALELPFQYVFKIQIG